MGRMGMKKRNIEQCLIIEIWSLNRIEAISSNVSFMDDGLSLG